MLMIPHYRAGKIKYLGLSEVSSATLRRAYAVHPIVSYTPCPPLACILSYLHAPQSAVQLEYSPFALEIESSQVALLKTCRELGVAVVAYSPLGRGMLTGTIKSRSDLPEGDWRLFLPKYSEEHFPKNLEVVGKIEAIAKKKGRDGQSAGVGVVDETVGYGNPDSRDEECRESEREPGGSEGGLECRRR